jgi:hypothetical protein
MGKQTRSPLLGYNHNVRYGGRILHVQTEDSGPANPHLYTHLFFEGSILATKRCEYDAASSDEGVRGLMQRQHKEILKELKQGLYDDRLGNFFTARGEVFTAPPQAAAEALPASLLPPEDEILITHEDLPELSELPPEAASSQSLEVLDLDSIPTPPPDETQTPEAPPLHSIRPAVPGAGTYNFRRRTRDMASVGPSETGTPPERRRFPRPHPRPPGGPASPVVVQRRIVVGIGGKTPDAPRPTAPRPRRPGGGVPYVVQEGSHPDLTSGHQPEPDAPPAQPMAESADTADAPRTAAPPPPPVPQEPPAESLVSTRSLDDVILAYLSKGDQRR